MREVELRQACQRITWWAHRQRGKGSVPHRVREVDLSLPRCHEG